MPIKKMTQAEKKQANRDGTHAPGAKAWKPGQSGNPSGRQAGPTFSGILREVLNKRRRYRKPDGTIFESSELELIIRRAVKELRTASEFDVRLLEVLVNRLDGKVKEPIDVEGIKEIASELNAQDIILSRLAGIARARGIAGTNPQDVSRRAIEDTVPVEPVAQN